MRTYSIHHVHHSPEGGIAPPLGIVFREAGDMNHKKICELPPLPEDMLTTMPQISERSVEIILKSATSWGGDVPEELVPQIEREVWAAAAAITAKKLELRVSWRHKNDSRRKQLG